MYSSTHIHGETGGAPRVEVHCAGLGASDSTLTSVSHQAEQLLRSHAGEVELAVVNIARKEHGLHHCDTQLFGRELEHVAGSAEHPDAVQAAVQSMARALRALTTSKSHNPWTSSYPACHERAK
jgi:hypothetical protein